MKINLRELQNRLQNRAALAVQVRSSGLSVGLVKFDGAPHLVRSTSIPIGADSVTTNPEKAGNQLAEQLRNEGIREKRCVVCVPPGWALSTSTDLPEIAEEDLRGYLELQAEKEFPIPVSELRIAYCNYVLPSGKRRATIVAVLAKRLAAIEQMLAAAGCRLVSLSLGLDHLVPADSAPGTLHFLANGTHVDLVIAAGGGIAALRSLSGSVAQGEDMFDVNGFCREVRITLGGLPEPVRQQVREAHFGGPHTTADLLRAKTRDQLQRMGVNSSNRNHATPDGEDANVAVEAAENYLEQKPVAFEFLPPQTKQWQVLLQRFDGRKQRMIAGGILALLLLPIIVFIVQSNIASSLQAEWDGMKGKVADLDSIQQDIRKYRPWFDPSPENLIILEGVAGAFPDQGDVWAKSIQITEGPKVTCSGYARSHAALLAFHDRLRARPEVSGLQVQQERGENPIQFSLIFKWDSSHAKP